MKPVFILLLIFLTISVNGYCQDTTLLKRIPYHLTVAVDKKQSYEEDLNEAPFIRPNNTVQLYPGETVNIEIEQENGIIKSITAVKEIKDSSKTVIISFTQSVNKNVHELMMLKMTNPFANDLIYKANIFLLKQQKWVSTSVYPVGAGIAAFETWPDIIISIGLNGWKFESI
jgi:hypothetical protein